MATQALIAQRSGVSQSAVSRILNSRQDIAIPRKTREKVWRVAKSLGYTPRFVLVENEKKTRHIGYLISTPVNNPFYHRLFEGVSEGIQKGNYSLLLAHFKKDELTPEFLERNKISGVIVQKEVESEWAKEISRFLPVVLLNYTIDDVEVDSVMPNNRQGTKKSAGHLYQLGHRRIALFGMKPYHIHTLERFFGYVEALKEFDLPKKKEYIKLPERDQGGVEEVLKLAEVTLKNWLTLDEPPTAVVTLGDAYGLPLLQAAAKLGISIPRQLSVVGFDNIVSCIYSTPSLTSVNQPMEEMGMAASNILVERISNPGRPVTKMVLDVDLVIRDSTGPVPV